MDVSMIFLGFPRLFLYSHINLKSGTSLARQRLDGAGPKSDHVSEHCKGGRTQGQCFQNRCRKHGEIWDNLW